MTERLQRIHAILRAGHVPCAMSSLPGGRVVLNAGHSDGTVWDVLVRDIDGELWISDSLGTVKLPVDSADVAIGDIIKFRVVQAWADEGDPAAMAVIAALQESVRAQRSAARSDARGNYDVRRAAVQLFDPLQLAARMFDAASILGTIFLTPPATVTMTVWSPWGAWQVGYRRH